MTACSPEKHFDYALFLRILIATFIIGLLCYGFSFFNATYAMDGTGSIQQYGDAWWKLMLGRFLQPFNMLLRGFIAAPWLLGALSLLWLSCTNYALVRCFEVKSTKVVYAICALITCNLTFIVTHASFIHEIDAFALAQLAAVLSVYALAKAKRWYLYSPLCVIACNGLYQPFFASALVLATLYILIGTLEGKPWRELFIKSGQVALCLVGGSIAYMFINKGIQLGLQLKMPEGDYNALPKLSEIPSQLGSYVGEMGEVLLSFIQTLSLPTYYTWFSLIAVVVMLGILLLQISRRKASRRVAALFLFIMMLLAMNMTQILKGGFYHDATRCAHVLFFVMVLVILERDGKRMYLGKAKTVALSICAVLSFSHIVYANQVFMYRKLIFNNAPYLLAVIVREMEQAEGYHAGGTPVTFVGEFSKSGNYCPRPGFEHLHGLKGVDAPTPIDDGLIFVYQAYFTHVLGYAINLTPPLTQQEQCPPEVLAMPSMPQKGYCKLINNTLYVKLSDPAQ